MTHSHPSKRILVEVAVDFKHLHVILPTAENSASHLFELQILLF